MPLKCKIGNVEIELSNIWIDEDAFNEVGVDVLKELIRDDMDAFVEEIKLLDHCEFYWR